MEEYQVTDGSDLFTDAEDTHEAEEQAAADTVVLPLSAIYQTGSTPQVWVVGKDKTLSLKNVSVEAFGDNSVKVTGLQKGDIVVTAGVHKLRAGEKVRIEGDDV